MSWRPRPEAVVASIVPCGAQHASLSTINNLSLSVKMDDGRQALAGSRTAGSCRDPAQKRDAALIFFPAGIGAADGPERRRVPRFCNRIGEQANARGLDRGEADRGGF